MNKAVETSPVYVIGAGGHAKVVVETMRAAQIPIAGILEDNCRRHDRPILGAHIVGDTSILTEQPGAHAVIAVGDNANRHQLSDRFARTPWVSVIHPHAVLAESVTVAEGTVVFAGVVIQPDSRIGAHVIVNTGATIDHDCTIGDYAHLAPGSHLCGTVSVGDGALIGVGAVVIPGITIGTNSVVGAGATVIRDVPPGTTVVGVPARPL